MYRKFENNFAANFDVDIFTTSVGRLRRRLSVLCFNVIIELIIFMGSFSFI